MTLWAIEGPMIRDLLLALFAIVWAFVVGLTVWRTGDVPAELWAVLGLGVGAILTVFARAGRDDESDNDRDDESEKVR